MYKDKNTEYVNTQVERIKSKITVKNIDDNKIGKTNTDRICELRGLSTPTQVPFIKLKQFLKKICRVCVMLTIQNWKDNLARKP